MPSAEVEIEIVAKSAAGTVLLDIEFKYQSGSCDSYTHYGWEQGDPAEIEIEHIYWPYERRRRNDEAGEARYVRDHIDIPTSMLPLDVYEEIEAHILETFDPRDAWEPDDA